MKLIPLETPGLTRDQVLQEVDREGVVFLTKSGEVRFAISLATDEDRESFAKDSASGGWTILANAVQKAKDAQAADPRSRSISKS